MGIKTIVVDVENWPEEAVDRLIFHTRSLDKRVKRIDQKPANFREDCTALKRFTDKWYADCDAFFTKHPETPKQLRSALAGLSVFTTRFDMDLDRHIWAKPGLNGIDKLHRIWRKPIQEQYPTFQQMLRITRKDPSSCPLRNIGKVWGNRLIEIADGKEKKNESI